MESTTNEKALNKNLITSIYSENIDQNLLTST